MEKRGQGKANFSLKLLEKMRKIDFELEFQTKIGFPLAPFFHIREVWTLSFLWRKKTNVVACLDRFLTQLVLTLPYLGG